MNDDILPGTVPAGEVPALAWHGAGNILVYGEHGTGKFDVLMGLLFAALCEADDGDIAVYLDPSREPAAWFDAVLEQPRIRLYVPDAKDLDLEGRRLLADSYHVRVCPFSQVAETVVFVDAWDPDIAELAARLLPDGARLLVLVDHWYTSAARFDTKVFTYKIRKRYAPEQRNWSPGPRSYAFDGHRGEWFFLAQVIA